MAIVFFFFFSSRRRHTRSLRDWSSDVCSSDLHPLHLVRAAGHDVLADLGRAGEDRKSVVKGKSVDLGGRRIIKKKKKKTKKNTHKPNTTKKTNTTHQKPQLKK